MEGTSVACMGRSTERAVPSAVAVAVGLCLSCSSAAPEQAQTPIRPAKLIEVAAVNEVRTVTLPAIIEAQSSVELTFEVGGKLTELPVQPGDDIKEGAIVAQLDQSSFRNERATAKAKFDEAESAFRRAQRLLGGNAISQGEYERRKSARNVARASLDAAKRRLRDATLRAPFTGVIATVSPEQFETVSAGAAIVTVQGTGGAQAVVRIPATVVAQSPNFEVEQSVVVLAAAPSTPIPAVLRSTALEADPATRTYLAKFSFTPPEDLVILPGMIGSIQSRIRIRRGDGEATPLAVPLHAVLSDGDARYVWLVDTDAMTVSRRDVVVGQGVGASVPVLEGLEPGDTVVGAGASYLHDGTQIRAYEP